MVIINLKYHTDHFSAALTPVVLNYSITSFLTSLPLVVSTQSSRSDGPLRYRLKMKMVRLLERITRRWSYAAKWRLCQLGAAVIVAYTKVARLFGSKRR